MAPYVPPDPGQLYATRTRGAPLVLTTDADELLATLGCGNPIERRRRGQNGRAFQPCPRCIRGEAWTSRSARVLFTDAGWAVEDRRLIRWFMKTEVKWLAVVIPREGDTFFVPAWAQQIRIATDLLGWASLTVGRARSAAEGIAAKKNPHTRSLFRVDAPGLVNLAQRDEAMRTAFMGVLAFLPTDGIASDNRTLASWAVAAKVGEKHRAVAGIFEWLETNAPAVMVDPRAAPPPEIDFDE